MAFRAKLEKFWISVVGNKVSIRHPSKRGCIVTFEEDPGRLEQGYIGTVQWTLEDLSISPIPTQIPTQFKEERYD